MNREERNLQDNQKIKCQHFLQCKNLYDENDFLEIRKGICNPESCGWEEDFIEHQFVINEMHNIE